MAGSIAVPAGVVPPGRPDAAPPPGSELDSHEEGCFACGTRNPAGLALVFVAGEGVSVGTTFVPGPAQQGATGLTHGGVLAAVLDETLGMVHRILLRPAVTARLETDFLRAVPIGTSLAVRAWADGVQGRKLYLAAEATAAGVPVARARALFVTVDATHFRP